MEQSLFYASMYGPYYNAIHGANARTTGLYALSEFDLANRWFTSIGARLDDHSQFGSEATYRLTTAYLLDEIGLKLRAAYGTSFKAPSLVQIHDNATGNPDLRPETSKGWEIGVESRLVEDRLGLGVTYFHTDFSEFILFDGTMKNITSASIRGGEVFASYEMSRLTIRADYTNTRTVDASGSGRALLRRPRHKLNLRATGDLTERLAVSLAVTHKGRRADLDFSTNWSGERVVLMDYTTVALGATYQVNPSLAVRARVANLLDAEYEEILFFGSAPRSLFVGFSLSN
jgi:vitamin B12 transporter